MPLAVPGLDTEQYQVDVVEIRVGELRTEKAVGLDRRVYGHGLRAGEHLHDEAPLHQRFATADRYPPGHDLEAMTVLAQLLERLSDADRNAVAHRPGVGVVAVLAAPHAPRRPTDDPHAGSVDRGPGGEGVHESHVAVGERRA